MINRHLTKLHIIKALTFIDKNGVPSNRRATKYNLYHRAKSYPPKYVLSVASKIATGTELKASQFSGGKETNNFLMTLGFSIRKGNKTLQTKKPKAKSISICTALIQIPLDNWDDIGNAEKFELLSKIMSQLRKDTDVLVLPAGFLNSKSIRPESIFSETEKILIQLIKKFNSKLFICLGIDGRIKYNAKGKRIKIDQLALTVDRKGINSIARKFHPTKNNIEDRIDLAENPFTKEHNKVRNFVIKGKRAYLAVCYDIFGISKLKLKNENNVDFIIGVVHGFGNGDSDFARKGLAGASKQWKIHSYASAVFSDNRNPMKWPSGVKWTLGNMSVKEKGVNYDKIRIGSDFKMLSSEIANVFLRYYNE